MQKNLIIYSILIAGLCIGGAIVISRKNTVVETFMQNDVLSTIPTIQAPTSGTSTIENGMQYIDITARGGYSPRIIIAKSGIPSTIRMHTENTFDCSSALVIPALGFNDYLKRTGVKEIAVPSEKAQGTLHGLCSMGMYTFDIVFE